MVGPRAGRWADARELSNETRPDLPDTFLLRLTDSVCGDLGIDHPKEGALVADEHELVRKFVDTFTSGDVIDDGVALRQVPGRGFYRIRVGEWRAVVWTDKDAGVVWLCRTVFLGDFPNEDAAYDALEAMGEALFPSEEDRTQARKERAIVCALGAIQRAMQSAHELPNTWHVADNEGEVVGRAHVEQIEEEGEVLAQRFLITVTRPPAEISDGEEWIALVASRVLPESDGGYEFVGDDSLPDGSSFKPGREVALAQETLGYTVGE